MNFKQYIAPIQKWWWLILAAPLLAGISSYLVTRPLPPVYQSSTTLMVGSTITQSNPDSADIQIGAQLSETYAEVLNTGLLDEDTKNVLGLTELPEHSATALTRSQLIRISVIDTNPERARRVADELAKQLIARSPTGSSQAEQERQAFVDAQLSKLQEDITTTQAEIASKQEELGQLFSASEIADLQTEITALETKLTTLQANYGSLANSTDRGAINSLQVIIEANLPDPNFPIGPNKPVIIVLSAVIGGALAVAAAFLLEFIDDTIKGPEEVTDLTGLPLLASLPPIKLDGAQSELIAFHQPRSLITEAFRVLRTGIKFASLDKSSVSIMVTSSTPHEGKSMVSANLAVVLAQTGAKVLLIDTDLRRSRQHQIFNLPNDRGLTSYLLEVNVDDSLDTIVGLLNSYIQPTEVPGLSLLSSGPPPPNPSELLGSTRMQMTFAALIGEYEYVVIDTTPVLAVTDALVISTQVDNIILVTRSGHTKRNQLQEIKERLLKTKGNVIGVVLNRWSAGPINEYYYYDPSVKEESSRPLTSNGTSRRALPLPWRGREKEKVTKP
jgi:succinoglycan biosynthesis transport protein ExoP